MARKITFLLMVFLGGFYLANAQRCGFDQKHQQLLANDPSYAQHVQQMNNDIANMIQANPNAFVVNTPNGLVYEIPLVIHVIHTGGAIGTAYNPSTAQLLAMVDYLNKSYSATWPAYPSATTGGTFVPLQFVLAKRDPNCATTTGINRVDGSTLAGYAAGGVNLTTGQPGVSETSVKALSRWPRTQYYNIWIVNKIDGEDGISSTGPFVAGYAYFPSASAAVDGTVMLASKADAGEITLPHEVGHAFNLYHTFEDDNNGTTCPPNTNCLTQGDMCCDTDPHIQTQFNCPTGTNPCTGTPFGTVVHNFMDYSNCQDRFTSDQRTRVMAALLSSNSRSGLISSLGGTAIGTTATTACLPTAGTTITGSNAGPRNITVSDASATYMKLTSSGYSGDGSQFYIDNTCKHQLNLTAGQIYNFVVSTGFNPEKVRVFIDYNNDGTFQTGELALSHDGTLNNETHTFQFVVPTTTTVPGLVSCTPLRMRIMSDRSIVSSVTACGQLGYGQAEDYSVVITGGGPTTGVVAVALTSGTNPSCFNSPLTFTATPGAGSTAIGYLWYVNNISTGVTTNTYSSTTLANNDVVKVKMYYQSACGNDSAFSNDYTVQRSATVPSAVSIALTSGNNPGCAGQTLGFTATPTNGGTTPAYTWKVNGTAQGTNSPTFTGVFANNDAVTVDMISNSSCASPTNATSNAITVVHNTITASVTIAIVSGTNPACAGSSITFEATPLNGGSNPHYQWLVNNTAIAGATNSSYTTTTLANNDVVKAVYIATDPCVANATDTSLGITLTINPVLTPLAVVNITKGSNPGCLDSLVEFTATVTNHGTNPNTFWYLNGVQIATGFTFSSTTLHNGDIITFRTVANDGGCYTADTLNTTPIIMSLFATPASPIISLIGNMLVANVSTPLQWYGPSGAIAGATGQSYHPTTAGSYYAKVNNGGCLSLASNTLLVSLLTVGEYNLSQVKIFPNPTTGILNFDWTGKKTTAKLEVYNIFGQGLMFMEVKEQSSATLDLSHFANGNYFVVIKDDAGKMATVKVVVSK